MSEDEHVDGNKTVLVVECDDGVRFVLTEMLKALGYEAFEAADGAEAVELAQERRFDCVIIEMSLPGKPGAETIPALRDSDPGCKIIAISGYGPLRGNPYLRRALQVGADAALDKPISPAALRATLEQLIAGRGGNPRRSYPSASVTARGFPGGGSDIPSWPS
jgi:two-component system response regulator (stage 0 sporulation protein F)